MDAKVLLIENEAKYLDTIPATLEGAGISVFTATHADVGISIAKNVIPSLILLNLATPGTNGLDVCKTLHSIDSLKHTPIILLTLREGSYDPIYESLYGIVGFIKKPFTPQSLIEQVSARLGEPSPTEPALVEEAQLYATGPNPVDEPEGLDSFDDLISGFEDEATPDSALDAEDEIVPPPAVMDATEEFAPNEEPQTEEFQFDDKSFTDALESEGIAPEDIPDTPKPFFKQNIKPKTIFMLVSIVLAIGIVGLGASFMLIGGGDETRGEPKTSIFESKTVLPKNADVHGIVPNSSITMNTTAASNTPTYEAKTAVSINTPVTTTNTPVAKAIAVDAPKSETKSAPKPEPKKEVKTETEKEPSPEPEKKATAHLHGFYVQFGAFGSKENAKKLAVELKDQGGKVMVKETLTKTGTTLYRVLYNEPFPSSKAAAAKSRAIMDELDIESSTYSE